MFSFHLKANIRFFQLHAAVLIRFVLRCNSFCYLDSGIFRITQIDRNHNFLKHICLHHLKVAILVPLIADENFLSSQVFCQIYDNLADCNTELPRAEAGIKLAD